MFASHESGWRNGKGTFPGEIVGRSLPARRMREFVASISAIDTAQILLTGEPGSGRSFLAARIHDASRRKCGPFVCVACGGRPARGLERELFGRARRRGALERAKGGTLFLDGVDELPVSVERRLARALGSGTFTRAGGSGTVPVDVRVLGRSVRDDADRLGRLNMIGFRVPSLRERMEDLPLLAQAFLERSARRRGAPARTLSERALAALRSYPWPGNVRELRDVLESLPRPVDGGPVAPEEFVLSAAASKFEGTPPRPLPEANSREAVVRALEESGGVVTRAARKLGMTRSTLHRRMKEIGIRGA